MKALLHFAAEVTLAFFEKDIELWIRRRPLLAKFCGMAVLFGGAFAVIYISQQFRDR